MHQVLKAGQSMIGLQYGTNKGASQVSIFSEYSTKKERSMKKRAGKCFFPSTPQKNIKFFHFSGWYDSLWSLQADPTRGWVSFNICHQLLTQNCILLDFGQALFFTILLSYFGIPIHLQNYIEKTEPPIKQTRCSCQWKYVKKSYCGLLRSNEDTAACFAIVCLFVYISLAFAGHSASNGALAATLAGAYLPHSASERS